MYCILGTKITENIMNDTYLTEAISEAKKGLTEGGIPIGSILVKNGKITGKGHNKRVQEDNPMFHAEIDCLVNAGRVGSYKDTVLYSTLMPCYLCAGAVVQFGIPKVIVGESKTFPGAAEFMRAHGVEVIDLNDPECIGMMTEFIEKNPVLWNEDIGEL
jgi:cytosine/creatinine deaminase